MAVHPLGDPAADPAVARDHDAPAGDQQVRRPQDPIERRLAGPVAVVEEVLRERLVDRDDREAQGIIGGHRLQPDHAGGRLLGAREDLRTCAGPLRVEQRDEVAAVVHRQLRMRVGDGVEMRVVGVAVLAAAREHADAVLGHERRGNVVLGRERVRGAQHDGRAAGLERPHQVGRLGGDVEAGPDAEAGERLLGGEPLADEAQHGHLALGPLDAADAFGRKGEIDDIVGGQRGGRRGHRDGDSLVKNRRSGPRLGQIEPRRWMSRSSKRACSW